MRPEDLVRLVLADPILVHVFQQIVSAKVLDELSDGSAVVHWHNGTVGEAVGRVRRWNRIVLSSKITVLSVGAIAKVRPETVDRPCVPGKLLSLRLKARVSRPKLRL